NLTLAKPVGDDKSFNEDKLRCIDSNEGSDYERNNPNSFSDFYRPRSKFAGLEIYPNRPFDYDKKRSLYDEINDVTSSSLQKRQVGVVYKDDKPIGILQPYQRSYRFIPVKEDNQYGLDISQGQDASYNIPSVTGMDKREINGMSMDPAQYLDASYPSILTNFKIVNKLDKKRNYDALTDENVRDLKATIRRLRSSNPHNTEQIEEELRNILDEMGLIDDEEIHAEKREITEDQKDGEDEPLIDEVKSMKDRNKRGETYNINDNGDSSSKLGVTNEQNLLSTDQKKGEIKSDINPALINKREFSEESTEINRRKRQKQEIATGIDKENSQLVENLKDSGDLMVSGNKSPLASRSEITVRDTDSKESEQKSLEDNNSDYEKRVERQIQNKINSLKEEVKREIEALKKKQNEDDTQRKKRQITENLPDEETDELNPTMNIDGDLKPLIRKRRDAITGLTTDVTKFNSRRKRETNISFSNRKKRSERPTNLHSNQNNYKAREEENDEGGELLGGDDFDEKVILKRQIFNPNQQYAEVNNEDTSLNDPLFFTRSKRSHILPNLDFYSNYLYNNHFYKGNSEKSKRQNVDLNENFGEKIRSNRFSPLRSMRLSPRFRRRINEDQLMANRPQQLSDMSDLDLFGALPKSYDGELSRYK
ncbi:serine/threonine-protein kinase pakA-like, partial [Asbolus verrucosus]